MKENAAIIHARLIPPLILIALLLVSVADDSSAADQDLQQEVAAVLREEGLTGAAWLLIRDEAEPILGVAGVSNARLGSPFSTDTRFHVGSVTKTLLSIGILRLATTGEIDIDRPISRYLTSLEFRNPWSETDPVTVRHLLDHTAGLDDARLWQMFSERADPDAPLSDAFPVRSSVLDIRSRPGTRFSYSNVGYTILGMVIESVTGERYETYLDRQLLEPLGMRSSTFAFTSQEGEHADSALAWGHVDGGERHAAAPMFLRPAGQFTTTIRDLARFARFLLDSGSIDGRQYIDPVLMQGRGRPTTTDAANNGLIAGYGSGIARRDRHGVVGFCHGGNIVGFVAMLCLFPADDRAFAYAVNTDSETAVYGRIDELMIEALGIEPVEPPPSAIPEEDIEGWYGHYVLRPNRFQTFEYLDNVFNSINVRSQADALAILYLQRDARLLRPVGGYLYSASDRSTTSHVLLRGDDGSFQISDGFQTYARVPAVYVYAHRLSIVAGWLGFFWLVVAGSASLFRDRANAMRRPETPALVAALLLFLPIPPFFSQSFMALGDLTAASATLAVVTLLFPLGAFWTVVRCARTKEKTPSVMLTGIAAVLVLQWCIVLMVNGLLPLRLWI